MEVQMAFKFLRKRKNVRIILWIITILIIPGFFLWGVGIEGSRKSQFAAVVNREPITLREFYDQLWKVEEKYKELFGENYNQLRDKLNLEKNVLESMIREKLLFQEARKRRIKVYKNEIINVIKQDPAFKNEKGEFDEEKYKQILSSYPDEELVKIEDQIRKEILIQKLEEKEIDDYLKNAGNEKLNREDIRKMILWQKREKYFEDWYKKLREKAKVIIYFKTPGK
jgi:parvulin-like peptidyl-prolyl isomerase